jgi:hypothetical protein
MSFDNLKIKELREVADSFAVEIPAKVTKQQLIMLLEEEGVTYSTYQKFYESEKVELDAVREADPRAQYQDQNIVLVKMVRGNPSYEWRGFTFTTRNPYLPMPERAAQALFDEVQGFVLATPREVQEFYG